MKNTATGMQLRPQRRDYLVFGAPRIEEEEISAVAAVLRSGWIGTGPKVAQFQLDFSAYIGSSHSVAVSSATAALHLSLIAAGIEKGDEVITTPMTFCASVNAIIHAGGTPVLADCDSTTMNIDPAAVEAAITPRTRAILPVHFAGRPCNMDALTAIADRHGLQIIEDCAHSIEGRYHGRPTGTFGRFGCFSFYVTKNVTTAEGGMVITGDEAAASRIKTLALHGMSKDAWKRFSDSGYKHYDVVECGFKCNMTDMQAALGLHQLRKVEENLTIRQRLWELYDKALGSLPLTLPAPPEPDTRHARHLYTVLVDPEAAGLDRDSLVGALHKLNIGVGVHYRAITEHPYYIERFKWNPADYPNATRIGRQTISLPLSARMTVDDAEDVIAALHAVIA